MTFLKGWGGTFYSHSAYIQKKTLVTCQEEAQNLTFNEWSVTAFQNLVGEHSIAGVPASLNNLIKSAPDPYI